ncbi:hypothetical protein AcV7_006958 [Taiwanofungus camphoratus]|nr:hypothetical protein AcV7_006958 [Antrodia cinnamomea]
MISNTAWSRGRSCQGAVQAAAKQHVRLAPVRAREGHWQLDAFSTQTLGSATSREREPGAHDRVAEAGLEMQRDELQMARKAEIVSPLGLLFDERDIERERQVFKKITQCLKETLRAAQ